MKQYYSRQDHLETEDNGDSPQLLLLSIQSCHQYTAGNNNNNSQEIKFSDTITVPTTEETNMTYTLTGYVIFTGDTERGHYKVIVRVNNDRWFLYDDETVKVLNVKERANHYTRSQVLFLLYAESSYYNNTSVRSTK